MSLPYKGHRFGIGGVRPKIKTQVIAHLNLGYPIMKWNIENSLSLKRKHKKELKVQKLFAIFPF